MRALLLASLLACAASVHADAIARHGGDWVRLTLGACTDVDVVAVMAARGLHPDAFRAASAHVDGHDFAACWQPAAGGATLIYSDGDPGFVPTQALKPVPEA